MASSVSSSVVSSVVRGIVNPRSLISYITSSRVLDLISSFTSASTTVVDRSPESNNATLYSGRYASTDGVADILFYSTSAGSGIDLTAAGAVSQITFKGRAAAGTAFYFGLASGVTVTSTQVGNNVWEDHTIVVADVIVTNFYAYALGGAADWSDVLVTAANASPRYQLNESADGNLDGYPAIDSSGNSYHGTHTGCAGGTAETTILQTAGMDWNKRMWFDGVDDYAEIATTAADFTAVSISEWVYLVPTTGNYITFSLGHQASDGIEINYLGATGEFAFVSDDGTRFSNNYTAAIGTRQHLVLTHDGTNMNAYLNGVRVVTDASSAFNFATATATASRIGTRWDSITAPVKGSIYDVKLYNRVLTPAEVSSIYVGSSVTSGLVHSHEGYGNTDDKWVDTVGSNNGTVNGTPSNYLIPASDSTPSNDALGNAIAIPRPTSDTFNGFSSTEYLRLPGNASLETVRSITVAIYNDGTTRDFVQAAGGASFVHSAANVLTTDQTGTHAYYVNGAATTTLAAGWNIVGITFDAGKDLSGGKTLYENAKLLAYDPTALTADQQLQNFNAFKSKFGL